MGKPEHKRQPGEATADAAALELLHREADGELTPAELALLDRLKDAPEVQAARSALRRAVTLLSGPNSLAMPRSLARETAAEIALSAQLTSPPQPRSVAASVMSDVAAAKALQVPVLPRSVAASVVTEIAGAKLLMTVAAPRPPASVAALVASRIVQDEQANKLSIPQAAAPDPAATFQTLSLQSSVAAPTPTPPPRNPAPLLLIGGLLTGLTLLAVTTAWPNLAAGATVLNSLLEQVSPLAGVGLALLLLTSILITWKPSPALRNAGAGAFALAAVLTLPALYNAAGGQNGLSIGHNVTVSGPVRGNVIAIGGNVDLKASAKVEGEVVTVLGDVHRESGSQVGGRVNALLGRVPGDAEAIQTRPASSLNLATAAAFRPVLGWLGSAAWSRIFVALTGGLLLLLFVGGAAPVLARKQRQAPMRTLALGVLLLSALVLPALALALVGLLGPALLVTALTALLIATGLSVSVYDAGRALAYRVRLPMPDAVGTLLGLSTFAASLSYAPLAFALALIGGAWGAGTLLLSREQVSAYP